MTDYTKIIEGLVPKLDGESAVRHRTALVDVVNADGTVDLDFDGTIVPDVSVLQGAAIAAGSVVQVAVWAGDLLVLGSTISSQDALGWTAWTPGNNTGFTIGDGTSTGRYVRDGNTITATGHIRLGASSAIASGCSTTFPVTPHASYVNLVSTMGTAMLRDNSTGLSYPAIPRIETSTRMRFITSTSPIGDVNATNPFTWASLDFIDFAIQYEAA